MTRRHPKERAGACYELLRREALDRVPGMRRGHGLALFLRRGMPAWLEVWEAFEPSVSERAGGCNGPAAPQLPAGSRWEVTTVMAQMILACAGEPA